MTDKTSTHEAAQLADLLTAARRDRHQLFNFDLALVPPDAAAGYEIAATVTQALDWQPMGWKIAGTTADVRSRLGINEPIYGRTFRQFATTSPVVLVHDTLLDPLVECEFFVTLQHDLPTRPNAWTFDEVLGAVGDVHAGIEIAECRFPMKAIPPLPAVLADGAASGRYVFGDLLTADLRTLGDIEVTLDVDGAPRRNGSGQDVMGDPLKPLHWLAETLRKRGLGLKAGEMISTGSCTGMFPVRQGQTVIARFALSASVEITFE